MSTQPEESARVEEVPVFLMAFDVLRDVPTGGHDTQLACPEIVERPGYHERSDPTSPKGVINEGVMHHHVIGHRSVLGGAHDLSVQHRLVAVEFRGMAHRDGGSGGISHSQSRFPSDLARKRIERAVDDGALKSHHVDRVTTDAPSNSLTDTSTGAHLLDLARS